MENSYKYFSTHHKDGRPLRIRPLAHSHSFSTLPRSPALASAPATASAFTPVPATASSRTEPPIRLAPVHGLPTPMSPIQSLPLPSLASITSRSSSPPLSPPHKVHTSSQLIEESDAGIFYYSLKTDEFIKRPVDQIVGPNGKIYVEHIPNHNIITLPKDISLQKFGRRINRKTFLKLQSVEVAKDKPTKPLNVFIRYRSANLKRARKEHPTASQTDISRILAEQWRNEDPSVKEQYINNFLAENYQYNIKFKEWKLRTEQREFDRLDDYDPETPSSAISFGLTPFSSESQPTESMYTSSSAHAVDMTAYGGPSNFNPARRRSHSVPPQSSECQLPPLKRQRPYQ